jgi:hypothetical protein
MMFMLGSFGISVQSKGMLEFVIIKSKVIEKITCCFGGSQKKQLFYIGIETISILHPKLLLLICERFF